MSKKLLLAFAACLPLALAGCSGGGGTPASSTPPVRVLGLDVTHVEFTDFYDEVFGRTEAVCPSVPPRGNECTAAPTDPNVSVDNPDLSVGRGMYWSIFVTDLADRDSWTPPNPKAGINFFHITPRPSIAGIEAYLGGIGTHSMIWTATTAERRVGGGVDFYGMHSAAMGELHDGRPAYSGPNEPTGTATWRGAMVGTEMSSGTRLFGDSLITYDFADNNVDVELSGISPNGVDQLSSGSYSGPSSFSWTDLRVNNDASFYIPGHSNDKAGTVLHPTLGYIDGDFYGPNAEETAGVFERQGVSGAWLAIREIGVNNPSPTTGGVASGDL